MSDQRPRRWFQFHLSTAVALLIGASVWVGINFIPYWKNLPLPHRPGGSFVCGQVTAGQRGFPMSWVLWELNQTEYDWQARIDFVAMSVDLVVGIGLLVLLAFILERQLCEWFIRRREGRKP
jgi:hypothetical protein